jgi:4-carboxymuconolactone decarboxylase
LGQVLIVTAGVGRVQRWGDPVDEIRKGDVVWIPPGQKHWHGAATNSSMAHISIVEALDGQSVEWMEKVSDSQYSAAVRIETSPTNANSYLPRPSQRAIGDFSPKLAELTDNVLYADVWERPELSKRDRSLVTVAALIALNRPEQLRSHLTRARDTGGADRNHHAPRVLLWVAEPHHRCRRGEGGLRKEMTATKFHRSNEINSKYATARI